MNNDRKVIIYGLQPDEFDPTFFTSIPFTFDEFGFPAFDLHLAGEWIGPTNPFVAEFDSDADAAPFMVPVVNFQYLAGPATGPGATTIFGRAKYAHTDSVQDPTAAQMVCDLAGELEHDAPAVNTAAVATVTATDPASTIRVTGFGFTVTAVAAIAAPLLVELRSDTGGSNVLLWSARVLAPAGTSKEVWIKANFTAAVDAVLTVAIPGATNFVTATIEANISLDTPPS